MKGQPKNPDNFWKYFFENGYSDKLEAMKQAMSMEINLGAFVCWERRLENAIHKDFGSKLSQSALDRVLVDLRKTLTGRISSELSTLSSESQAKLTELVNNTSGVFAMNYTNNLDGHKGKLSIQSYCGDALETGVAFADPEGESLGKDPNNNYNPIFKFTGKYFVVLCPKGIYQAYTQGTDLNTSTSDLVEKAWWNLVLQAAKKL